MKKLLLTALAVVGFVVSSNAQEKPRFGVTAGYINTTIKVSGDGMSASVDESGFFVGANAVLNFRMYYMFNQLCFMQV